MVSLGTKNAFLCYRPIKNVGFVPKSEDFLLLLHPRKDKNKVSSENLDAKKTHNIRTCADHRVL